MERWNKIYLEEAVDGSLVLDGLSWGHHHATTDGVDGVGHESGGDGHTPTQDETEDDGVVVSQQDGLERIVQTEVHASVDEDADARDDEAAVQTDEAVGLDGLDVDVDHAVELALLALGLGVVG